MGLKQWLFHMSTWEGIKVAIPRRRLILEFGVHSQHTAFPWRGDAMVQLEDHLPLPSLIIPTL